jgi:Bax protein
MTMNHFNSQFRPVTAIQRCLAAGMIALAVGTMAPVGHALVGPLSWLSGFSERSAAVQPAFFAPLPFEPVRIQSAARLERLFDRLGYRLDAVGDGIVPVPAVELVALPPDLSDMASIKDRKALFIRAILPVVLRANEAVLEERARLEAILALLEADGALGDTNLQEIRRTAERYGTPEATPDVEGIRRLLRRVDAIPVSLAVAQAILESGWGTSRFAVDGNALFGQWTWDAASGIVPAARAPGKSHRVRAFHKLADSAKAYVFNLNTHPAYRSFRQAREAARRAGGDLPSAGDLARHLGRYSERGDAYTEEVRAMIRNNRLAVFDGVALGAVGRIADADPVAVGLADG